jgi:hypothetical protein
VNISATQFQVLLNRGWKLLLIGLMQGESFARYEAMVDLGRSFPNMIGTLNDWQTRSEIGHRLMNISVADERRENRIKAIYLLGQYALNLGDAPECFSILYTVKLIIKYRFLSIYQENCWKGNMQPKQYYVTNKQKGVVFDDIRLHLIRAIGKFTSFKFGKKSQVLVIYMLQEELSLIFAKKNNQLVPPNPDVFVLLAIFDLLNYNVNFS